ncbi:MAG TPA: pirin family protein [Candidatus Sulfotelmatobacter sp.]|nr:pirin family protein [Candidatus Sulfotelmatobacter sp.]
MIQILRSQERGGGNHGWLKTHHTFSFNDYWNPKWMGFRSLRVINEDWVAPNAGFPTHPHRDMEIITYVLEGKLEHKDSLGTGSVILPGDGQRMTAGSGIRHSEFNPSTTDEVHLLQIWILPEKTALPPSYEQKSFPENEKRGRLRLIASPDATEGSVKINQDAKLYVTLLKPGEEVAHEFGAGRHGWLQVARGGVELNGKKLGQGDGAAISNEKTVSIKGTEDAEVLLFDLA